MKIFVVLSCLVAVAVCAPSHGLRELPAPHHEKQPALHYGVTGLRELPALRHEEVHDEFGQYALRYITAENTVVSERGYLVPSQNGGYVLEIEGQYQFIGDDGQLYVTRYHGGPNGFRVDGDHLPVPVPVPAI